MTFLRHVLSDRLTIALLLSLGLLKTMLPKALDRAYYYSAGFRTLQSAIYTAIGVKLIFALNKWITHRSINNFVDDTTWDWPKELAVVTGGSSGIGAETVRELNRHNVKTIILDINPPTSKQCTYEQPSYSNSQLLTRTSRRSDFLPSELDFNLRHS